MKNIINSLFMFLLLVSSVACDEKWDAEGLLQPSKGQVSVEKLCVIVSDAPEAIIETIQISDIDHEIIVQWPATETRQTIALDPGTYTLTALSCTLKEASWDTPYYEGNKSFRIEADQITDIDTIKCHKKSVSINVGYENDILALIDNKSNVIVNIANDSLIYSVNETRTGCFTIPDGSSTVVAQFNGIVNGDSVVFSKVYSDITAGDDLSITFTYDNLVQNNESANPNAPKITSETLNLDSINTINDDIVAKIDISAPYGIKNLYVKIISEQLNKEVLQSVGLDSEFDLANPGIYEASLTDLGFPVGDAVTGQTQLPFDITSFMPFLKVFPGEHRFEITVIDTKELSATETLAFLATDPNAPKITSETLNLHDTNIVTDDLQAKVDIAAPYGITSLTVKIISEQLNKEVLQSVGLDSEFDLANPGIYEASLSDLGLPVGNAVSNQTQLLFDITNFMPFLKAFSGEHRFVITVTDTKGLTSTETLTFLAQ